MLSVVGVGPDLPPPAPPPTRASQQIELPFSHHRSDIAAAVADVPLV